MVGNEEKLQALFPHFDGCYPKFYCSFHESVGFRNPWSLHHPCASLRKPLACRWDCFIHFLRRSAFCPFRAFPVTWVCEHHECHEYWFQENRKQVPLVSLDKRIDTGKLTVTHAPASRATLPKGFIWAEKKPSFQTYPFCSDFSLRIFRILQCLLGDSISCYNSERLR